MLLTSHPKRLSTDIDIIVEPGTPVEDFISTAATIFPFIRYEEQKRIGASMIEKRHFKFYYNSPLSGQEFQILLDVVFEKNKYSRLEQIPIANDLLISSLDYHYVSVPGIDCILGDKLTAFAPHTIGIQLNSGKDMEVMKQFYDICTLLEVFSDYALVSRTYRDVAASEIAYRGTDIGYVDALNDTYEAAACIASRGKTNKGDYPLYVAGIRSLRGHLYEVGFTPETAAIRATRVMYMAACLLNEVVYSRVDDPQNYLDQQITHAYLAPLRYLRKVNPESYAYAIKIDRLLSRV